MNFPLGQASVTLRPCEKRSGWSKREEVGGVEKIKGGGVDRKEVGGVRSRLVEQDQSRDIIHLLHTQV